MPLAFKKPRPAADQSKRLTSNASTSTGDSETTFSTVESPGSAVQRLALLKGLQNKDELTSNPRIRFRKDAQGDVEHVFRMVSRVLRLLIQLGRARTDACHDWQGDAVEPRGLELKSWLARGMESPPWEWHARARERRIGTLLSRPPRRQRATGQATSARHYIGWHQGDNGLWRRVEDVCLLS